MKIKKIQENLSDREAALIVSEENLLYLTEFHCSNGYLLICPNFSVFLTDSRYIEAAKKTIKSCDDIIEIKSVKDTLVPIIENLGIAKVCIEQSRLTLAQFESYKNLMSNIEFDTSEKLDKVIYELRKVKTTYEVEKIKQAQEIAELAFEYILDYIDYDKTEKEIALELDHFMLSNGADAISFETIVVSGKNSSMPHGVPSNKLIENGDFITMDFGCIVDGYHSDMTRTIAVGNISEKQQQVYDIVLNAQMTAMNMIKPDLLCSDIDKVARDIITDNGYGEYFGHSLGHGVGIEIHENPSFSPKSQEITQVGNVITVEPGIYIPNEFGVRIEDMIVVTENGFENLTSSDKNLIIL